MTADEIIAARAIIAAATRGPWSYPSLSQVIKYPGNNPTRGPEWRGEDAKFISASRTGWEAALDNYEIQIGISSTLFQENLKLRAIAAAAEKYYFCNGICATNCKEVLHEALKAWKDGK